MKRRRYSPNKELGSLLYGFIYTLLLWLGIKLIGNTVFNEIILVIIGILAYWFVGYFLRTIGIWKY